MSSKKARFFSPEISDYGKRAFFVLLFLLVISFLPGISPWFTWLDNKLTDSLFTLKPHIIHTEIKHPAVVIVKDQTFFERFGRDPERRDYARLLNLLQQAGCRVATLDFIYDQPGTIENDQPFLKALNDFPFVIAAHHFVARGKQTFEKSNIIDLNARRPPWPVKLYSEVSKNISETGLINLVADNDSTVRYAPLAFLPVEMHEFLPSLGFATYIAWIFEQSSDKIDLLSLKNETSGKDLLLQAMNEAPHRFSKCGHLGIDQMTRRMELRFLAATLGEKWPELSTELKNAAENTELSSLPANSWLKLPERKLPIIGSYEMPCMRLNFQKTPAPNKSDGIESFSLGVLLPTKRDRELAAHIFKPDLTVNEDFKQREVAVDFKWQPAGQASISGTVMTLANKPVASAQVLLEMPQSGFWQMTYSKQDGSFFLNNLPAGNFTLSVLQAETDGWINSTCAGKLEKQSKQELPNLYAVPCKSQVSWADKPTAANVEFCFFGEAIHLFKTDESGRINLPELPKNYDLVALAPDIEITEFKNSVLYGSANKTLNKETIALLPREETWNHKFLFKANPAAKEITLPGSLDCQLALLSARQGQKIQSSISFQTLPGQALQLAELPAVTRVASSSNSITFTGAPDIDQLLLLSETRERFVAKINEPINLPVGKYRIMAGKGNKRGSFNRLKAQLKNRVVFIGTALPEDQDFVTTPINFMDVSFKRLPGVHIHANLFSGLARNDFLAPSFLHADRAPHSWPLLQILAILPVLLLCNLIFAKFGAFWGGLSIIFSLLAWGLVTTTAFINATIFPAFFPALNITAFGIVRGYLAWEISKRKEQETRSTFGRFISSAVVNEILKKPGSLKPGGEKKELSVMFTDLAGFTTISEKLSPEQLTELMNEYLGEMTNLLFKYQGTLDKYIGDAIMAFWNHPVDQPNHPDLAAECAIAMQKKLDELRQKWLKQGLPEVKVRAGINTASCMVGFIGSDVQMNFTCLGDGVNLASRLEGANKPYDTLMMISESVNLRLDQNKFSTRFLDYLAVKGKDQPIKVYELRGLLAEESEEWLAAKDHYQQGMQHYLERNWGAAIKCFKQVLKKLKNDSPSRIFIERSEHFKQEPPPENWDGRFVLKTK